MSERPHKIGVEITAKDKTGAALNSTKKGFNNAFNQIATGALRMAGERLAGLATQIPQVAAEMAQLGIQSQATTQRFERFAGGTEQATMYLEAFNTGTQGTVDRMTAMSSGAKLLQMGLVDTGDEMSQIAAMATRLGDQTLGASERISGFALMLSNTSIPRLDNYGISSGKVRKRIQELQEATKGLSREEAFKIAVMEEGAAALEKLGDTTGTAQHKMDLLKASVQDAKIGIGELMVEVIAGADGVDDFAARIRGLPDTLRQVGMLGKAAFAFMTEGKLWDMSAGVEAFNNSLKRSAASMTDFSTASEEIRYAHQGNTQALERERDMMSSLSYVSDEVKDSLHDQVQSQGMLMHTVLSTAQALEQETGAMDTFVSGISAAAQLNLSMSFTGQLESMEESVEDFAKRREEIEAEHQTKITELMERAQATAVRINVEAEQAKLAEMQRNLEIAMQQQAEFTEKTKESTQMRKEDQINELQSQIAQQQQLLDNYYAGRLTKAGENVDGLIEEENRRKDAAIAALDEQIAKQAELQRQQEAQMLMQAFDMWSEERDIPVEKMAEMRTAIAEEYGLVGEGTTELVTDMMQEWDSWATGIDTSTSDVVQYMDAVIDETGKVHQELLALTAHEWTINVRYNEYRSNMAAAAAAETGVGPAGGPMLGMQHGGRFLVGEAGPEIITVQPINNINETVNIGSAHNAAAYEERRRRERRILARTM